MTAFRDRHVVVTGGSEGIGLAVAAEAARRGASEITLIARRADVLEAAAAGLDRIANGTRVNIRPIDVTDEASVFAAFEDAAPVDIVICAAGYAVPGYAERLSLSEFRRQMEVNYLGTVNACQAALGDMLRRGDGHLVMVSSTAGILGVFGYTAYSPTKFAVRGYAEALRWELNGRGVRVSVVFPPDTDTPGFAAENRSKPPETAAVSASITPRTAADVGRRIANGIERDRFEIFCDLTTRALAALYGPLAPLARRYGDWLVRRSRSSSTSDRSVSADPDPSPTESDSERA